MDAMSLTTLTARQSRWTLNTATGNLSQTFFGGGKVPFGVNRPPVENNSISSRRWLWGLSMGEIRKNLQRKHSDNVSKSDGKPPKTTLWGYRLPSSKFMIFPAFTWYSDVSQPISAFIDSPKIFRGQGVVRAPHPPKNSCVKPSLPRGGSTLKIWARKHKNEVGWTVRKVQIPNIPLGPPWPPGQIFKN
jgi:hypothetical protein